MILIWLTKPICSKGFEHDEIAVKETNYEESFGVQYIDHYRWMENLGDPRLSSWLEAQRMSLKTFTEGRVKENLKKEFSEILTNNSSSEKSLGSNLFNKNLFISPIKQNSQLGNALLSPNKKYEIVLESDSGSDLKKLKILDLKNKKFLPEILDVKFFSMIWGKDNDRFYYISDRDGRMGGHHSQLRMHKLNTRQSEDQIIFEPEDYDTWLNLIKVNHNYFLERVKSHKSHWHRIDIESGELFEFLPPIKSPFLPIGSRNNKIYFISFQGANFGKLIQVDAITAQIETIVPETTKVLDAAYVIKDSLYLTYIDHTQHILKKLNLLNGKLESVYLRESGSIYIKNIDGEAVMEISHYHKPKSTWVIDKQSKKFILKKREKAPFDIDAFRLYYQTHHGQSAPIWILKKSDMNLSPQTPCYIYGYGGFRVNILPNYQAEYEPWLRRGGCVAFVTLPGGMEYGEEWHRAGMKLNKINVFKDFAAAAKTLYENGVSSPTRAAIGGASNGGLLVAATMNLYPNLFQAAVPEVGVLDMTRFELFSGGKWWVKEYGSRFNKSDFMNLFNISPYHQLKPARYPHTLVITSDLDDRVIPSHSYKYSAKLQELQAWDRLAFLFTRKISSHSRKSGTLDERISYLSHKWTFLIKTLKW